MEVIFAENKKPKLIFREDGPDDSNDLCFCLEDIPVVKKDDLIEVRIPDNKFFGCTGILARVVGNPYFAMNDYHIDHDDEDFCKHADFCVDIDKVPGESWAYFDTKKKEWIWGDIPNECLCGAKVTEWNEHQKRWKTVPNTFYVV